MSYEEEAGHPEAILVIQRSIIHEAEGVFGRLHPLASDLAAEMANFAHDIESVTGTAIAEKAMLDQENAR